MLKGWFFNSSSRIQEMDTATEMKKITSPLHSPIIQSNKCLLNTAESGIVSKSEYCAKILKLLKKICCEPWSVLALMVDACGSQSWVVAERHQE